MTAPLSKVWKTAACDEQAAGEMAAALGIPFPLAQLLAVRGHTDIEETERFLNPRLNDLSDPFLLPDMGRAVEVILQAIVRRDPILIYGDYDVDGITSSALMVNVLSALGGAVTPFLPHRIDDGYGLNEETLSRCIEQYHPRLIVTVDCGTGSVEAVQKARAQGVEVVVTDHHEPPPSACAPAAALVNPKLSGRPDTQMLAGVGVAFKLCHALVKKARADGWAEAERIDLRNYLDLVALGTIADIVPLVHENRILAHHGLALLNRSKSVGIKSLLDVSGVTGPVDSYHIGFILGPRINAAGRMGSAQKALELLLTDHAPRARDLALELDAANRERQEVETAIVREACARIDAQFDSERHFGLVVADSGWHAGVIGIVASRLAGKYARPVVVIGIDSDGVGRGSCRSIEGFDLLAHLARGSDLLLKFGGHSMAAGLEIEASRIAAFEERFNALASETLRQTDLRPIQAIDAWLPLSDVNMNFLEWQDRLKPFGHGNRLPIWAARDVRCAGQPRIVGKAHLKMRIAGQGVQCDAIGFGMADRIPPDGHFDLAFSAVRNTYMGENALQLHVQDFRSPSGDE